MQSGRIAIDCCRSRGWAADAGRGASGPGRLARPRHPVLPFARSCMSAKAPGWACATPIALVDFDRLGCPTRARRSDRGRRAARLCRPQRHPSVQAGGHCRISTICRRRRRHRRGQHRRLRDGRRTGHNTDCWGFAESFVRTWRGCRLDSVVQFGAGGAGAAVAHALLELGVGELALFDTDGRARRNSLARTLAARFGGRVAPRPKSRRRWPRRRHRQHDAGRHGEVSRPAISPPSCWRRGIGWPRSSIPRRKPNCCGWPARWAAARSPAREWRSTRR